MDIGRHRVPSREEFELLKREFGNLSAKVDGLQEKWARNFGSDEFRKQRALAGATARWRGHKAKRPKRKVNGSANT